MNDVRASLVLSAALVFGIGCATAPKVQRTEVDQTIDLSGDWNDTDSRMTAEEMVKDSLSRPWLGEFSGAKGVKPRVIVGTVLNKSHEHINRNTLQSFHSVRICLNQIFHLQYWLHAFPLRLNRITSSVR
jgi:PBP1b-binding outer membrane lipoprotein LpoB